MARPRTPIGTFGNFLFDTMLNGTIRARVRFRYDDGRLRLVQASGENRKAAERKLKEKLAQRGSHSPGFGELTPDSRFTALVDVGSSAMLRAYLSFVTAAQAVWGVCPSRAFRSAYGGESRRT